MIKSVQTISTGTLKVLTIENLIEWMSEHGVFDILWDTKKTHLQLVQRSGDIFKVLA